jgi:hypothetical protein
MANVKLWIEFAAFGFMALSAALWFQSAAVRLRTVGSGQDELDHVTGLSSDLQLMAKWNFWAALATGISVTLQLLANYVFR